MITQESEGFLHGYNIKKMADNSINISPGKYTTCDYEHPHFYLRMTKARMVTEPKKTAVFGPAYLVLEDVPLPLALPFGFVPLFSHPRSRARKRQFHENAPPRSGEPVLIKTNLMAQQRRIPPPPLQSRRKD